MEAADFQSLRNPNHEGNSNSVTQNPLTAAFSEQKTIGFWSTNIP